MLKKISLKVQILLGFAVILVIMLAVITIGFTGVGNIVDDSVDMITGENIKSQIRGQQINLLNWMAGLSEYLSNPEIKELTIHKDFKKCGVGKFLYGKERKNAEKTVPALAKIFKSMETTHKQIHESALEIERNMNNLNIGETLIFLNNAEVQLRIWKANLLDDILGKKETLSVNLDGAKSTFGKWLTSGEADAFEKEFSAFAFTVQKLKAIHKMVYSMGGLVNKKIGSGDYDGALSLAKGRLSAIHGKIINDVGEMSDLVKEHEFGQKEAARILSSVTMEKKIKLLKLMQDAGQIVDENIIGQDHVLASAGKLRKIIMMIGVISMVLGIILSIFLANRITGPIIKSAEFAKAVAGGDFKQQLSIDRNDEIGTLVKALNSIVVTLGTMFKEILGNMDQLSASSVNLKTISHQMTSGSDEASQKTTLVAAAAEELSSNMNSVAAAMEQASTNVGIVATAADNMASNIDEVVQHTEKTFKITENAVLASNSVSAKMKELDRAAQDIGKVTETITEISDQTNLLALNATIEAARAGEAGKGFAVVANEIKELAGQTANATKEIKNKIDGIQGSASSTITEIEEISKIINDVNQMVSTIAGAVEEQSNTTKEIANNVGQASDGISEVAENIAQSSTVSGEIARDVSAVNLAAGEITKSSSQVDSSSMELSSMAETLKEQMKRFKT